MITAFVLMNVQRGRVNDVAHKLADMEGVSEVYSVAGRYDLVAVIRAKSNEELAEVVTDHMQKIGDVRHTETLIAFQSFSRHDLEAMFSIGLREPG
jgi:DNA-binding Lrp family transcriptional regulator